LEDRYTRGFISGAIAGVPAMLLNYATYYLNINSLTWIDFASIFIYGRKNITALESLFGLLAVIFFTGLVGTFFAFIVVRISSKNLVFKSWMYGVTIWFSVFAITNLFKVPELVFVNLNSAFSNFLSATIWGITLGYVLKWFDERVKTP
jgi:hypothetical protein